MSNRFSASIHDNGPFCNVRSETDESCSSKTLRRSRYSLNTSCDCRVMLYAFHNRKS
uniref:Uncharacterized protein n=1 Tax=Arundo donax TaxID=35708 RepID=A0A0A9G9T3_ARUDO